MNKTTLNKSICYHSGSNTCLMSLAHWCLLLANPKSCSMLRCALALALVDQSRWMELLHLPRDPGPGRDPSALRGMKNSHCLTMTRESASSAAVVTPITRHVAQRLECGGYGGSRNDVRGHGLCAMIAASNSSTAAKQLISVRMPRTGSLTGRQTQTRMKTMHPRMKHVNCVALTVISGLM